MTKEEYVLKMKEHEKMFERIWVDIVDDTNKFIEDKPEFNFSSTILIYGCMRPIAKFIDSLCLSGAWVHDRLTGHVSLPQNMKYRGILSKKIRKALGYTY